MRNLIWLSALMAAAVVACGGSSKNKNTDASSGGSDSGGSGTDSGSGSADAPPAAAMITISGTALAKGLGNSTPVSGATVAAYPASDHTGSGTALATTTTDGSGNYTLTISTGGVALDAFIKATDGTTYLDTYLWPPAPLTGSAYSGVPVEFITSSLVNTAAGKIGTLGCNVSGGYNTGDALFGLEILASFGSAGPGSAVAGASVTSTPAASKYCYDTGNPPEPNINATVTGTDGVALVWNVTPGATSITATETGDTFAPSNPSLYGVAGAVTTTIIVKE